MKDANNRLSGTGRSTYPVRPNEKGKASLYNDGIQEGAMLAKDGFAERLASLRGARQISAREMSLSLGQGAGYINNIENGHNLPSMSMFFDICEFLGVSPGEFFSYSEEPGEGSGEIEILRELDRETRRLLVELAKRLQKDRR